MTDGRGTIREIAWQDLCPWLIILRTFRLAISFRVLVLSAAALVAVSAGWKLVDNVFYGTVEESVSTTDEQGVSEADEQRARQWIKAHAKYPWETTPFEADGEVLSPASGRVEDVTRAIPAIGRWLSRGPVVQVWRYITGPFLGLFDPELSMPGLACLSLCCLWSVVVWALFGGAITRIAALDLARDETLGMVSAVRYSSARWPAYFLSPVLPLVGVLLAVVPLMVLGWMIRVDFLLVVAGLFWVLVLVAGLFMAIVLIGLAAGWPLMLPTISSEGTDAFDALSRSYAYIFQRPLHYLFYALIASLLGIVSVLVVDVFADAIVGLGEWGVSWGASGDRMVDVLDPGGEAGMMLGSGAWLVAVWTGCVTTLKVGFPFGFFWTAATAIYLLLRRDVDATEMDEVALEEQDATHGLPPLAADASGVPGTDEG